MVARRSPAMMTPSAYWAATIVVACGSVASVAASGRTGSSSGAAEARKSVNDDDPGDVA